MMMVPKSLTKANLLPIQASMFPQSIANAFPIQASMLPQGIAKISAFQASGQNIKSVISHNDEPNYSGLTIRQQANSKQVSPRSSRSSENTGVISEPSINRIRKEAQLAAERMFSAYTVQAVSPPIENKPEELITQATSPTALSNSPWPMAYPNSIAFAMPLNSQRLSTTQAVSHLNQAQATSALPFTGSIPKESNPLPANNLGFPNPWNPLNFQYPYRHRNTPSAAMQDDIPPVPTGLFNGLHRVIQEIAKSCGCCGFTEKTAIPAITRLSAQSSVANSHRLNNNSYDRTTTMG